MNEDLINILERAYEAAMKTGEFVVQEGSVLIQQFLLWKLFEYGMIIVFGLIFLVGTPLVTRKVFKRRTESHYDAFWFGKPINFNYIGEPFFGACLINGFFMVVGFIMIILYLFSFVKLIVAPNVYLLEYFLNKV